MGLLIRIAWRNIWRQKRRTLITVGAMAIGLAFCMSILALTDGVYRDLFDLVVTENLGHAQVHDPDYPKKRAIWETIDDADGLVEDLEAEPTVSLVSARVFGYALLGFEDRAVGAQLIGVDPLREHGMTAIGDKVTDGRFLAQAAGREMVLGNGLADRLKLALGDEVVAVTQAADGSTGNDLYTVVGIFESGSVVKDRSGAYLHATDARELLALEGQSHEIALRAVDRDSIEPMLAACGPRVESHGSEGSEETDEALEKQESTGPTLRHWGEINPQMFQMMEMADASSVILLFVIFGVAALGILNTMLMSVFERTKELGVIRALGLRPRQMVALVMWETAALVVVALVIGVPIGLGLDAYLVFHGLDLSAVMEGTTVLGVDYDPLLMGEFQVGRVVETVVGLFVISFLAALWPAIRAARLKPVEAMRQE